MAGGAMVVAVAAAMATWEAGMQPRAAAVMVAVAKAARVVAAMVIWGAATQPGGAGMPLVAPQWAGSRHR